MKSHLFVYAVPQVTSQPAYAEMFPPDISCELQLRKSGFDGCDHIQDIE